MCTTVWSGLDKEYGVQCIGRFPYDFTLLVSDAELDCDFSVFEFCYFSDVSLFHHHPMLSWAEVFILLLFIWSHVMKPGPPLRIDIFPCGYVTKLERIDCLFLVLVPNACATFTQLTWVSSYLRGTGDPAHESVARNSGSLDFIPPQAHFYISDHVHLSQLSLIRCSLVGGVGGVISPPVLHHSSWHLLAGSSTAVLDIFTGRENPLEWEGKCQKTHIWGEKKMSKACQCGDEISWERLRALDKHWDTSGSKWMGVRLENIRR